jgi:hypothetical protein
MEADGESMPGIPDIEGMALVVEDAEGDMDMEGDMDGEVLVDGEVDEEPLEPQAARVRAAVAAMRAARVLRRAVRRMRRDMCVDSL